MVKLTLGIIGGGQLGSMLASAAKKINIKTVIFCDDQDAPAQKFSDDFVFGKYDDEQKINEFVEKVDIVTFEFENIPFYTLNKINQVKKVLPKPSINKIVQHRLYEKDFINKCNFRTTLYDSVKNDKELKSKINFIPGIIKTCTFGYDGKGQYKINSIKELKEIKEYYASLIYNLMVADGKSIGLFEVAKFICWGTPEDLEQYLFWSIYYCSILICFNRYICWCNCSSSPNCSWYCKSRWCILTNTLWWLTWWSNVWRQPFCNI